LIVDPCIPAGWKEFHVTRRWRGATFAITVKNPSGVQKGVTAITLNGEPVSGSIKPQPAGTMNELVVLMG
jgi:N,N'-diacetylchitobiose phosphorylase